MAVFVAVAGSVNTLVNGFAYDDIPIIVRNPAVTDVERGLEVWTRDYWLHDAPDDPHRDLLYRPLTVLTYRLNYAIGGLNPFGYHLINVVLHATVAAMVVVVATRLCRPSIGMATSLSVGNARAAGGKGGRASRPTGGKEAGSASDGGQDARPPNGVAPSAGAVLAGVLFAAMPIHTEAVANVVGRAELLVALFTLLAVWAACRAGAATAAGRLAWWTATGACALAALLAKENGITAVVLVPLAVLVKRRRVRVVVPAMVAAGAALVPYLALRYQALGGRLVEPTITTKINNLLIDATGAERVWGALQLLGMYVAKTFWPQTLCMDYSYKAVGLADSSVHPHVILGLASLVTLAAVVIVAWRRGRPGLAFCAAAIVVSHLPVSNTLFLVKTFFAERVWYLPSAFLAMLAGAGLAALITSVGRRRMVIAVTSLVVMAGLARSWVRNADWRSNGTLFASAYRVHPTSAPILYVYGQWLVEQGEFDRGIDLLTRCVQIAPEMTDAHLALGAALLKAGDAARAIEPLQTAAMQRPSDASARALLAEASRQVAQTHEAEIARLQAAFDQAPDDLDALLRLTDALVGVGRTEDALRLFEREATRFSGRAEFHRAYAVTLMTAGQRDRAIEEYRAAIAAGGPRADVLAELAMALLDRQGPQDLAEVGPLLDRAAALAPDDPQVLLARAEWLVLQGRRDEAVRLYRQLIDRLPPGEYRQAMQARLETLRHE